jgi:hypothetical protein
MGRTRSASITPTFSSDRALLHSNFPESRVVSSFEEARAEAAKWMIAEDSIFQRRANLTTDEEWNSFMESCTLENEPTSIDLDVLLKKCYAFTYAMPHSPTLAQRESAEGSSSIPALSV